MTADASARCAVHPERAAALACLRCGTFTCEACSPVPSILCAECVSRVAPASTGAAPTWAAVPDVPGWPLRLLVSLPGPVGALALALGMGAWLLELPDDLVSGTMWTVWVAAPLSMIVVHVTEPYRRALRRCAMLQLRGEPRQGAVETERTLRTLPPSGVAARSRLALLHVLSVCASEAGAQERALAVARSMVASSWARREALHRTRAQLVITRALALTGDVAGATEVRSETALPWWWATFATAADEDALISARSGRYADAHAHLERATRFARRLGQAHLLRWTSLLDAFVLEQLGASAQAVDAALGVARGVGPDVLRGLTSSWPELAEFVARRVAPTHRETHATAAVAGQDERG